MIAGGMELDHTIDMIIYIWSYNRGLSSNENQTNLDSDVHLCCMAHVFVFDVMVDLHLIYKCICNCWADLGLWFWNLLRCGVYVYRWCVRFLLFALVSLLQHLYQKNNVASIQKWTSLLFFVYASLKMWQCCLKNITCAVFFSMP